MFRKLVLGTAAAAAFLGLSLAAAPVNAAPVGAGSTLGHPGELVQQAQYYYGPRRYYRPYRHYGPRFYGPRRFYGAPRFAPPPYYYGPRYYRGPRYFY